MKRLALALLCASCAHAGKQVVFTDKSEDNTVGWVCVPSDEKDRDWSCMSIDSFTELLRRKQSGRSDM